MRKHGFRLLVVLLVVAVITGCAPGPTGSGAPTPVADPSSLRIVAGSEVQILEDAGIFADFTKSTGIKLSISYKGSVDIRNQVEYYTKSNPGNVDVFWAASQVWLPGKLVENITSVLRTYIVLVVDTAAPGLNWEPEVYTTDIISAVRSGNLKLAMSSASQDDAGAMFYLATLSALKGGVGVIQKEDLKDQQITDAIKAIYGAVDGSAGTTALLVNKVLADRISGTPKYNAAVMPEASAIALNKALVAKGLRPLTVFYIRDAAAAEFFPLGYVNNKVPAKLDQFNQLVTYLKSADVQKKLEALGWRTRPIGMAVPDADPAVFNPEWGIDTKTDFLSVVLPKDSVISEALNSVQSAFRKASFTAFCLDFSGSMGDNDNYGANQVKSAMNLLLDQSLASQVLLQATPKDKVIVFGFHSQVWQIGDLIEGNDFDQLKQLSTIISRTSPGGTTAMFDCAVEALETLRDNWDEEHSFSVIVLTDGKSNAGLKSDNFPDFYRSIGFNIPVYPIMFGFADDGQLKQLAAVSGGAVFDGRKDMALAFRQAKANN